MSARMIIAAMILIVGACGNGVTDSNPKRLIRLRGNVTSAVTKASIQGAQVSLIQLGGLVFPDRVLVSTTTAAAGNYSLEYSATVISGTCGLLFLNVRAAVFRIRRLSRYFASRNFRRSISHSSPDGEHTVSATSHPEERKGLSPSSPMTPARTAHR